MSDVVITVENLSKSYLVGHQSAQREWYTALRDVIGRETRNFARKAVDVIRGRQIVQGDEVEEFWALKGVSFEVKRGEVLGIIGRNGAGKSTLLKILSRITEPTEGRVVLRGRVASLLEVGTGFHPELTGRENIFLNGAILGMTRAEVRRKFDEIVAFADVEKFLDTPVKRYSSGMYVRLAFGVAAHLEPEILIVDEVLAVGDAEFQKKCLGKMKDVAGHGRTVLFVSHNMQAMRTLCDSALLLANGLRIEDGPVDKVIEAYLRKAEQHLERKWTRPSGRAIENVGFEELELSLVGEQPTLKLHCLAVIGVKSACADYFIAVDITDAVGTPIMQALPSAEPFLRGLPGRCEVSIEIILPPLIPGRYLLTFWAGPHNSITYDEAPNVLAFEVSTSPTPGRTFPHSRGHGYIVPPTCCNVISKQHERDEVV